jgi:hypothetical protein
MLSNLLSVHATMINWNSKGMQNMGSHLQALISQEKAIDKNLLPAQMLIVLKQAEMTFFQPHQNPHGQDLPPSEMVDSTHQHHPQRRH